MKKNPLSLQVDMEDFLPATDAEKEYMVQMRPSTTFFKDGMKRLLRNKVATVSMIIIIVITLAAIIIPYFWPYSYDTMLGVRPGKPVDASFNNLAPFQYGKTEMKRIEAGEKVFPHVFGTDSAGRDYFIRVVYGTRVSLGVGFFASLIVLVIGITMGSIAGYCGGKVDMFIMRLVDIIYSLPDTLMIILLASVMKVALGPVIDNNPVLNKLGSNMISLFIVFALLYWVSMARQIRGQILSLKEQEYVLAARSTGAKAGWIITKHLIPNCISVIIISTALQIPSAIFTESFLSYLGLGVNAPMPSLGSLASEALNGLTSYPYRMVIPAITISLIVLSLKEQEYVLAARSTGAKAGWIITKHLIPNCISVIIISTALQIPSAIFTESFLSYLGLGVNAPMPSLGSLASEALNGLSSYPYRMVIPALAISLIVLSLNLFGDGLRDAFDPKLKS